MNTPLYEGQEVRVKCECDGVFYGILAPDPAWPGVVIVVNDKYPWGTYCGVHLIQAVE